MKNIYLSPSDQRANIYACDRKTSEAEVCRKIALALKSRLEKNKNFEVKVGAEEIGYTGRAKESNSWGADMHIPIHTNAGGGQGCMIFTFDYNGDGAKLGEKIIEQLAKISGRKGGIRQERILYEINNTYAPCCYIEVDFHDNKNISQWLMNNVQGIAQALYLAICDFYGVETNLTTTDVGKTVIWRVYAGKRYLKKANAEKMFEKMLEKGMEGLVIKRGKHWLCQMGSYQKKDNASACLKKIESRGVSGFIKEVEL